MKTSVPYPSQPDRQPPVPSQGRRSHSRRTLARGRAAILGLLTAVLLALAPGRAAANPAAIFVSNSNGYVPAYDATGAAATGYTAPAGFSDAEGVAYNPATGMLYVADANNDQIRTFNAVTGAETQLSFTNANGLNGPLGLALNAGVLYAVNGGTNTILAYNAATGQAVTSGFNSPMGLNEPYGLAVNNTTLFVANYGNNTLSAYNLATGTAAAGFTTITGLNGPVGVALYGNDLFVSNVSSSTVGEYNATTGAVINAGFIGGTVASNGYLGNPEGLAILGNQLLVVNHSSGNVEAFGIPDTATPGNTPTSLPQGPAIVNGLNDPTFIAVVPEPGTWALLGLGVAGLGVVTLRRRQRLAPRA